MKKLPPQIAAPTAADEVTAEVKKLLRAADVKDQLPTPKPEILACTRLVETGEFDLAEYEASFTDKALAVFHKALSKVRGLLDRRSEQIYVDPLIRDTRRLFITYHEVSHRIIPWQRITYTEDDDSTLSLECSTVFEAEANHGAAEILFQCDRFENEARDYGLSIQTALYLAERYGASFHSAVRRFVERNHRPCMLLVLKATTRENSDGTTSFYVVYSICSKTFALEFGDPFNVQFVNPDHEVGKIVNSGSCGEIPLCDIKGSLKICSVEFFNNNYHTFVLVYPKDLAPSRRTVIFRN